MQPTATPTRWYDKPVLVNVLLFLFFPVGLYGLWKSSRIAPWWKVGGTVIIAILVLAQIGGASKNDKALVAEAAPEAAAPALSPAEQAAKDKADKQAAAKAIADQTVEATQLVAMYAANEVKADQQMKGKTFYVKGTVDDIKKDIMDDIYVALEGDGVLSRVQCFMSDENAAANLSKGQQVLIKGTCDGLMMNVMMKDCELVE